MAPKKKKSKDRKGKAGNIGPAPFISEREQYLQKEFAILTEHVGMYAQRVQHFQGENEFLDKEAQQIRENTKAYLSYLNKRTVRCQTAIVTLNDQNRSDLAQVQKQKEQLIAEYTDKEKVVKGQLIEMKTKYSLMNKEVKELQPFKQLQLEQLIRIRELEKELLAMKIQHSEQMHKVKSKFLTQKAEYEMESQQKVQSLVKLAEKEAVRSLIQHTKQVKTGNWRLRHDLLNLIRRAEVLKGFMIQLRGQQQQLLQEHQYSEDLARMRYWLRQRGARLIVTPGSSSFRCSPTAKKRTLPPHDIIGQTPMEKEQGGFSKHSTERREHDTGCDV